MSPRSGAAACSLLLASALLAAPLRATGVFTCAPNNDAVACAALGDLFSSTHGLAWSVQLGWADAALGSSSADYCTFFGITCDAAGNPVTLALPSNLVVGSLPASLGNLTTLTSLQLDNNFLMGSLPTSLASLRSLLTLTVTNNLLSGALPAALAPVLSGARDLSIANNWLDSSAVAPALCALACNASMSTTAFVCPSLLGVTCGCAPTPTCQLTCALPSINASSWGADLATACSGVQRACTTCLPALKTPLVAVTNDIGLVFTCIGTFVPRFLELGVPAATLDATALCLPPGSAAGIPTTQPCSVTIASPRTAFAAATAACIASMANGTIDCGVCAPAVAAPFVALGVTTPVGINACMLDYSAAIANDGIPIADVLHCPVVLPQAPAPARLSHAALGGAIGGAIGGAALLAAVVLGCVLLQRRLAQAGRASSAQSDGGGWRAVVSSEDEVQLQQLLGSGGFASVYRAQWHGTQVAVKVFAPIAFEMSISLSSTGSSSLKPGESSSGGVQAKPDPSFGVEVDLLSRIRHPNIAAIFGLVEEPRAMLIMELGAAGSLRQLLERSTLETLSWAQRVQIGAGVACGVAFLHAQTPSIYHLDLKPANVVLDAALVPKVCDLGISTLAGKTLQRGHRGTPAFMAPEVARQLVITNYAAVDAYGIGVVLLALAQVNTDDGATARLAASRASSPGAPESRAQSHAPDQSTALSAPVHMQILVQRELAGFVTTVQPHVPVALAAVVTACLAVELDARPSAEHARATLAAIDAATLEPSAAHV